MNLTCAKRDLRESARERAPGTPILAVLTLTTALSFASCVAVTAPAAAVAVPDSAALIQRVRCLAAPAMAGRGNGTAESRAAADTIAAWLARCGLEPGVAGGWYQDFPLHGEGLDGKTGRNVVATLKGSGRLAGRVVIVGAHYDHLGRLPGQPEAGPARPGAYYPGANDNASGVSVLIELACQAARAQAPAAAGRSEQAGRRRCLFVAFAGEEVGLQGSSYLVKHLPVPRDSVDVMINFDTVGQMLQNELYVGGIGTAAPLGSLVEKANPEAFPLQMSRGGWSASDHVSFSSNGVPVLFVFTGAYPQYNRPEDSWSTIDAGCLGRVAAFGGRLLGLLRTTQEPLTYIQVNEAPLLPEAGGEPPRRAWLGTIPDFTEEVTGVKLAGVIDGSPAAQAGLAAGDVLVMLAGEPVADLAGFTRILREHQPGQEVDLEVLRNGQRLRYSVVLADRADRKP